MNDTESHTPSSERYLLHLFDNATRPINFTEIRDNADFTKSWTVLKNRTNKVIA